MKYPQYGYNDPKLVTSKGEWTTMRVIGFILAIVFISAVWFGLTQKLLLGDDWISATYDNEDWKTNEGNLHTFGAWDIETHIWKTEYIMENFPHFQWSGEWYMGMPLLKYYQYGYYVVNALTAIVFGISAARAALLLVIFAHLAATILTFLLCYKMSRRIWLSALCSMFVLANTFISLRSYGWEPITVIFLWMYPLILLLFFREPTRPFRLSLIIALALAYYSHPLLFFAACMTMGLYLTSVAIRDKQQDRVEHRHYIWHYFGMVFASLGLGAVQFLLQMSYHQVTSGAHMGVKYLPFYQVPFNIITLKDFLFDAGNLKGPGFVIMIALVLLVFFSAAQWISKRKNPKEKTILGHELVAGLAFVLGMMILFYYIELWNVFPMNLLRSIQYHRIIPEFIVTACALIAVLYNLAYTKTRKTIYYMMLIAFVLASSIVIWNVQEFWATTDDISHNPEFLIHDFEGRISHPYTDQSLAVRSSFQEIPQVYGYYEQGITNSYNDEIFSVSSGYHNADATILYLKAANVARLYTNMEEGKRDALVRSRMNTTLNYVYEPEQNPRYGYFEIPLADPDLVQAVPLDGVALVRELEMGCREMFKETYCASEGEEFVTRDPAEQKYLRAYVDLLEEEYAPQANDVKLNPDNYRIDVINAQTSTAVVVKMTYDHDFEATLNGKEIDIQKFGPDYMLLLPNSEGDYTIHLSYKTPKAAFVGLGISVATLIFLIIYFAMGRPFTRRKFAPFKRGDMQ